MLGAEAGVQKILEEELYWEGQNTWVVEEA